MTGGEIAGWVMIALIVLGMLGSAIVGWFERR